MSKVTITGLSGFLGTNLRHELVERENFEHRIFATFRPECDLLDFNTTLSTFCDIDGDILVHCAGAVGGIQKNMREPAHLMLQNLKMGMNAIEAAVISGVKRIILIGTVCSYGERPETPFKESSLFCSKPDFSNRSYGVAKLALMELLCAMERQHGIKHHTLMLANMFGKYDNFNDDSSHVIPGLIKKFMRGKRNGDKEVVCFGSGLATRDLLWAPDACDAIIKCIKNENCPNVMNIGTGIETSIKELSEKIADIVGYDGEILWDTTKSDGQPRRVLDYSLAKQYLGWEPKMSLDEGLRIVTKWYMENNCGP